jgi:hypothetical protein
MSLRLRWSCMLRELTKASNFVADFVKRARMTQTSSVAAHTIEGIRI